MYRGVSSHVFINHQGLRRRTLKVLYHKVESERIQSIGGKQGAGTRKKRWQGGVREAGEEGMGSKIPKVA